MSAHSIRARLLRSLCLIILLALAVSGTLGFMAAHHEVDELFDAHLASDALIWFGLLDRPRQQVDWPHLQASMQGQHSDGGKARPRAAYAEKVAIQAWAAEGPLLLHSASAPAQPLAMRSPGFVETWVAGSHWHVHVSFVPASQCWLMVAERADIRHELSRNIAMALIFGFVLSLGVALWLLQRSLGHDLAPLRTLSTAIASRQPGQLDAIELADSSSEIAPITDALNHLFGQVTAAMERERAFMADAAHELRTPLAVIRLHAQNALLHQEASNKDRSLHKVLLGVERSARVVEQLLWLARLDAQVMVEGLQRSRVSIADLLQALVVELRPLAAQRQQQIELHAEVAAAGEIDAYPDLLQVLLKNLLENALKYSPEGTTVQIGWQIQATQCRVWVRDQGPGVPEEQLALLGQRFQRLDRRDVQGHGLGLEIASRIAQLHEGSLQFANLSPHGLEVVLGLPCAQQA